MNDELPPFSGQEGDDHIPSMPVEEPRRAASLTLRDDDGAASRSTSMDVANQSLADALRIIYRLLQVVMVGLLLMFIFSGLQQVNEGERGLLLTFGKANPKEIQPGFVMSMPHPIGEVIKVSTGTDSMDLLGSFWPKGLDPSKANSGRNKQSLKPGEDGALLTSDHNIVHAQLTVSYHRADAGEYVHNIYPDHVEAIVRANVERATVQVVAATPIDDMLQRGLAVASDGSEDSLEARIRNMTQRALDRMESGLGIDRVTFREIRPPPRTMDEFNKVNEAVTAAARIRVAADREREELLTSVAGSAYRPLLAMIDEYERMLDLEGKEAAEVVMTQIRALLDGELNSMSIQIGEQEFGGVRFAGEISTMISDAKTYRSTVVSQAKSRTVNFTAKLEQYRANPKLFLTSEWVSAMIAFFDSETVETWRIAADMDPLNIRVNPDPQTAREIERELKRREVAQSPELQRAYRAGKAPGEK